MHIKSEYKKIIEETVKRNKNFEGNEDFLDEFCDAIYKKTYLILSTKETEDDLRNYLRIVSHKIMLDIIKKRTIKTINQELPYNQAEIKEIASEQKELRAMYKNVDKETLDKNLYFDYVTIIDPLVCIKKGNSRHKTKKIVSTIYQIHQQMPEKLYYQIFYYKYCKELNQTQVAKKLGISQGELSKRILELMQILKGFKIKLD